MSKPSFLHLVWTVDVASPTQDLKSEGREKNRGHPQYEAGKTTHRCGNLVCRLQGRFTTVLKLTSLSYIISYIYDVHWVG